MNARPLINHSWRRLLNTPARAATLLLPVALLFAGPLAAADDAALMKDLTAVITLIGAPCGKVVSVKRQGDNDNLAACSNGMRYRVFVNPQGRVVAQKQ